jgi:hypothetical protein
MYKKIFSFLIFLSLAAFLALVQFSLISFLPWPWSNLDIILIAIIFSCLMVSRDRVWFLALAAGFFIDVFSFHPFGLSLLSLFLSAVIMYFVLENVLTNRSLYSFLLLSIIGITAEAFIFNILLVIFDWSGSSGRLFLFSATFWESLAWSLALGVFLVALFFNLLALASRRLQPFFLKGR